MSNQKRTGFGRGMGHVGYVLQEIMDGMGFHGEIGGIWTDNLRMGMGIIELATE